MKTTKSPIESYITTGDIIFSIIVDKELTEYERNRILDEIDEVCEYSFYSHTVFKAEIDSDILSIDNGLANKIKEISEKIDQLLTTIQEEAVEAFNTLFSNLDTINNGCDYDVMQHEKIDNLPVDVRYKHLDDNRVSFTLYNDSQLELGLLTLNDAETQIINVEFFAIEA